MRYLILSLIGAALASCAAPDSYYLLNAQKPVPAEGHPFFDVSIGVGPVLIPDYIDRPEIVFQSSSNKFEIPGTERWAGALKSTITNVIATNLARSLNAADVRSHPWEPGTKLRYSVAIDVQHFHAQTGGNAVLEASWRLYDESTSRILEQRQRSFERPLSADGYEAVVKAESLLLMDLADDIASALR